MLTVEAFITWEPCSQVHPDQPVQAMTRQNVMLALRNNKNVYGTVTLGMFGNKYYV